MNIFGNTDALIGSIELLIMAVFVLGAFIFRKIVANEMLDREFSVIGSCFFGCAGYLISTFIIDMLKINVVIGLGLWAAGGFLLSGFLGDGES